MNRAAISAPRELPDDRRTGGAEVRELNGYDERSIAETRGLPPLLRMLALLERVATFEPGSEARESLRELPVGECIGLMLLLRKATLGSELACELSCPKCGEQISMSLSVEELLSGQGRAQTPGRDVQLGGFLMRIRPVLARDLDPVFEGSDVPACVERVVRSCVLSSTPPLPEKLEQDLVSEIAAHLGELDAWAEAMLNISCPACADLFRVPFWAEEFFLREMDARYPQLEREIHWIALNYHWSEDAILSLPSSRRKLHVELISTSLTGGVA